MILLREKKNKYFFKNAQKKLMICVNMYFMFIRLLNSPFGPQMNRETCFVLNVAT